MQTNKNSPVLAGSLGGISWNLPLLTICHSLTSKVIFLILIGYEALSLTVAMVIVTEWQIVSDDKFHEMPPRGLSWIWPLGPISYQNALELILQLISIMAQWPLANYVLSKPACNSLIPFSRSDGTERINARCAITSWKRWQINRNFLWNGGPGGVWGLCPTGGFIECSTVTRDLALDFVSCCFFTKKLMTA